MLARINKWIDEVVARVISQRVEAAIQTAVADHLETIKIDYRMLASLTEIDVDYKRLAKEIQVSEVADWISEEDVANFVKDEIEIDYSQMEIDYDEIKIDYDEVPINYQMLGRALVNLASQAKVSTAS